MIHEVYADKKEEPSNLEGTRTVLLAGIVTSIDAAAVGVSYAMTGIKMSELWISLGGTFLITLAAALVGICCGSRLGKRFDKTARILGGAALIIIGLHILIGA